MRIGDAPHLQGSTKDGNIGIPMDRNTSQIALHPEYIAHSIQESKIVGGIADIQKGSVYVKKVGIGFE
jgi:hypothetical protein